MKTLSINLTEKTREKLRRLALQYGFSLQEFSARILEELSSEFPEESLANYQHPKRLRASLKRAMADFLAGRTITNLRTFFILKSSKNNF